MNLSQSAELSADMQAWREQTRQEFKSAIRTLHSKMKVPTCGWAIMAMVDVAMRYAIEDEQPEDES